MDRQTRFSFIALSVGMSCVSVATIISTYRLNQVEGRVRDHVAVKVPGPVIIDDPDGLCVYDAIKEKIAPGSGTRKLTPEEIEAFRRELESFGGKAWKIVTPPKR